MLRLEWIGRDTVCVRLTGAWRLHESLPSPNEVEQALAGNRELRRIALDASGVVGLGYRPGRLRVAGCSGTLSAESSSSIATHSPGASIA